MNTIKNTLKKRTFEIAINRAQMIEKTKETLQNDKLFMRAVQEVKGFDINPPFEEYYCFHSNMFNEEGACLDAEISLKVILNYDPDPYGAIEREEIILKSADFKLWKNEDKQIFLSPFQENYLKNIIEKKIELLY